MIVAEKVCDLESRLVAEEKAKMEGKYGRGEQLEREVEEEASR